MAQDSMDQYRSIAAFDAVEMGELSVIDGEVVTVIEKNTSGKIMYSQKSTGLLPCMMSLSRYIYCCKLSTSFIKLDCHFFTHTFDATYFDHLWQVCKYQVCVQFDFHM